MADESHPPLRRRWPLWVAIALALSIVAGGLAMRSSRAEQLRDRAATRSVLTVALITPSVVPAEALQMPARIEAWSRAPIHARVSGYLKRWNVDIGAPVKAGQLLAEIETPDLDQALQQARAELLRARGEATLAETTARRWQSLQASESVSRQEVDERQADWQARQAQVVALQAAVDRTQALHQYKRLVAPFDGVVTARSTDVGSLITAGTDAGNELFVVSDVRRLRVYVNVPQRQVGFIRIGAKARVSVPERPGQTFDASVLSLAQAINRESGAMRAQLTVENPSRELLPGGFATVRFELPSTSEGLGLPPSALIVGRKGVQIAIVDAEERVQLKAVTIARDRGNIVEIADGLETGDRVIANPPDGLASGERVRIAAPRESTS